jgi:hypothetical protein
MQFHLAYLYNIMLYMLQDYACNVYWWDHISHTVYQWALRLYHHEALLEAFLLFFKEFCPPFTVWNSKRFEII